MSHFLSQLPSIDPSTGSKSHHPEPSLSTQAIFRRFKFLSIHWFRLGHHIITNVHCAIMSLPHHDLKRLRWIKMIASLHPSMHSKWCSLVHTLHTLTHWSYLFQKLSMRLMHTAILLDVSNNICYYQQSNNPWICIQKPNHQSRLWIDQTIMMKLYINQIWNTLIDIRRKSGMKMHIFAKSDIIYFWKMLSA